MSLFQASNIIPSTLSGEGEGTIDVANGLTVQWQINGDSPLVAYQIDIMQNDTASTPMYSTGKVTLSTPFYGKTGRGIIQYFQATPITATELNDNGIVNGYANGYKFVITQWWTETNSIIQTSATAFITRATPTLTLNNVPSPLTSRYYTFTAEYEQEQNDSLSWVRWQLAEAENTDNPLSDTGNIYGTAQFEFYYNGFFTDTQYAIRSQCQTEHGITADTGWVEFTASYSLSNATGLVTVCQPPQENFLDISWISTTFITGKSVGEYEIKNEQLFLEAGATVTWNENDGQDLEFVPPWSLVWKGKAYNNRLPTTVLTATGDGTSYEFVITETAVELRRNGVGLTIDVTLGAEDFFTIIITPEKYYIKQETSNGGLYPNDTLYPDNTLYPKNQTTTVINYSGNLTYDQTYIADISLTGPQVCEYVWLYAGTIPDNIVDLMIQENMWYQPQYDQSTYLVATFNNGLVAQIQGSGGSALIGASIYRLTEGENTLQFITDVTNTVTTVKDYSAASQTTYTYYIFLQGDTTYLAPPFVSEPITPIFWDWVVIEAEQYSDGLYHAIDVIPFSVNVASGNVTNNNNPNIMLNFTKYPLRQPQTANFKSGTLTACMGKAVDSKYVEEKGLSERIYNLSTSTNAKFLKNRRGDFWQIEIMSPTSMQTGDQYFEQPQTVTLAWVEVDTTENKHIVSLPGDDFFPFDMVIDTTLAVDLDTMELIWTTPSGYKGSILSINRSGELVQTYDSSFTKATLTIDTNKNLIATTN